MNTRRHHRMGRIAAERMLGADPASPGAAPDPMARLLAAAAAPGRAGELAGEESAVAAFHAEHLASVTQSRRGQMMKSPLAKLLTAKALAGCLAVCATGGVALAASSSAFSGGWNAAVSSSGGSQGGSASGSGSEIGRAHV